MLAVVMPSEDGTEFFPGFKVSEKAGCITYVNPHDGYSDKNFAAQRAAEMVDGMLQAVMEAAVNNGFNLVIDEDGSAQPA